MGELIILLLQIIGALLLGAVCLALIFGIAIIVAVFGKGFKKALYETDKPKKKTTRKKKSTKK